VTVHVNVEEIVLSGLSIEDVPTFRAALRERLTELAAGHRGELRDGTAALRRGTPVTAGPAAELASRVAGSVWTAVAK
jgi:hypothetical protein